MPRARPTPSRCRTCATSTTRGSGSSRSPAGARSRPTRWAASRATSSPVSPGATHANTVTSTPVNAAVAAGHHLGDDRQRHLEQRPRRDAGRLHALHRVVGPAALREPGQRLHGRCAHPGQPQRRAVVHVSSCRPATSARVPVQRRRPVDHGHVLRRRSHVLHDVRSSSLYYRYFEPTGGIVGATRYSATGCGRRRSTRRRVRGMFLAGGQLYFADSTLRRPALHRLRRRRRRRTLATVDSDRDWRARGLALRAPAGGQPGAERRHRRELRASWPASFDGAGSSDSDGTIVSYAWNFGDGEHVHRRTRSTTPTPPPAPTP